MGKVPRDCPWHGHKNLGHHIESIDNNQSQGWFRNSSTLNGSHLYKETEERSTKRKKKRIAHDKWINWSQWGL
jgi:hypothetical protein